MTNGDVLSCRLLGHRWRFRADGTVLNWTCDRCGTVGGRRAYGSAADAQRYARALDEEPRRGARRFLLGAAPVWLWRKLRARPQTRPRQRD